MCAGQGLGSGTEHFCGDAGGKDGERGDALDGKFYSKSRSRKTPIVLHSALANMLSLQVGVKRLIAIGKNTNA
jgi:hypothetical protein